jgi:hypothetical protein
MTRGRRMLARLRRTLTAYVSTFADSAGFATDPIPFDTSLGQTPARLVLIGSTELKCQRARYREGGTCLRGRIRFSSAGTRSSTGCGIGSPSRVLARCIDETRHDRVRHLGAKGWHGENVTLPARQFTTNGQRLLAGG